MYEKVKKTIQEKKLENNQIQQLSQQLQQAQANMEQMQKQLTESTKKLTQLNEKKLNMEHADNVADQNIKWFAEKAKADFQNKQLEMMKEKNKLEAL